MSPPPTFIHRTTLYPDRPAWLAARAQGLGASSAAGLLGLSPHIGPWDVIAGLRRGEPTDDSDDLDDPDEGRAPDDPLVRGTLLEPVVLQMYGVATGTPAIPAGEWFAARGVHGAGPLAITRHPALPWLSASLDALTPDGCPVEAKTDASRVLFRWAKSGTELRASEAEEFVPVHYLVQLLVQLAVTGAPYGDFAILSGGFRFRWIRVYRDEDHERQLLACLADAWERHVIRGEDPDPDASDACVAALRERYRGMRAGGREATEEEAGWIDTLLARREAEEAARRARAHLLASMGPHDLLTLPGRRGGVRRNAAGALTAF